nr:class I SAM-dependent methyltransferase [Rhodopirellula sp. SM50]
MSPSKSRLTGGPCSPLFSAKVLGQYDVVYSRCDQTGFIQTEPPYWLDEAYQQVIADLDIGLLQRNAEKVELACEVLRRICPDRRRLLDYGGGYGVFTRMMRDRGFPFQHTDAYCECLFAKGFEVDLADTPSEETFDCITAWEVFEHLEDPMTVFDELLGRGRSLLFSTILVPDPTPTSADQWWYFLPETGQHVSFYTQQSLQYVADHFGAAFYTDGVAHHLLTRETIAHDPFRDTSPIRQFINKLKAKLGLGTLSKTEAALKAGEALRQSDYQLALQRLHQSWDRDGANQNTPPIEPADG